MNDSSSNQQLKIGMFYAFLAYFCWGFFPIYWKFLKHIPAFEISFHRILWSFVFYTIALSVFNKKFYIYIPKTTKEFFTLIFGASMLMANWFLYIYAVNSNQIVESSLGYFINPFFNISLGIFLLSEKITKTQLILILWAAIGVFIIGYDQGHLPWIALVLASTFSIYGVMKKKAQASGFMSNQFESMFFVPIAIFYLTTKGTQSDWLAQDNAIGTIALLMGGGLITGLPLIFFAEAAQRIPYYLMGFFQFLAPTLQFLSGVLIFKEPLSQTKMVGFLFIWSAIICLAYSGYRNSKSKKLM